MTDNKNKLSNYILILFISGMMILVGQWIGYKKPIISSLPGLFLVLLIAFISLVIKEKVPQLQFPAFAWASLISFVLSMPFMPTAELFLKYTNEIVFLGTTTPILAFAGISVGNKLQDFKKLGWKVFIVAIMAFTGTYFGSAIVAHVVLKLMGKI